MEVIIDVNKDLSTKMFITALFVLVIDWKPSKC